MLRSIEKPPPKKAANYSTAGPGYRPGHARRRSAASLSLRADVGERRGFRPRPATFGGGHIRVSLDFELVLELALHRYAADVHVVGQAVAVGGIGLARDQRLEVAAASLTDAEAVCAQVLRR